MRFTVLFAALSAVTGQAACTSTFSGDSKTAQCAKFCNVKSKGSHCPRCQCKTCSFCLPPGSPPPPPPPPPPAKKPPPMACTSGLSGDTKSQQCATFCNVKSKGAHCARCQCKACSFCAAGGTGATPAAAGPAPPKATKTKKVGAPPSSSAPPAAAKPPSAKPPKDHTGPLLSFVVVRSRD